MKKLKYIFGGVLMALVMGSCAVDNYEEPSCHVYGHITYKGERLGLKNTGQTMTIELWQSGFGLEAAQVVGVKQDGMFSTYVYPGHCRLVAKNGLGPWESRHDTVHVDVKGDTEVNYEVVPYYTISDVKYSLGKDSVLTATFNVTKVSSSAQPGTVGLLVNKTRFVDLQASIKSTGVPGTTGKVTLTLDLKDKLKSEHYLFARVYVKPGGVDEALYSVDPYQVK